MPQYVLKQSPCANLCVTCVPWGSVESGEAVNGETMLCLKFEERKSCVYDSLKGHPFFFGLLLEGCGSCTVVEGKPLK